MHKGQLKEEGAGGEETKEAGKHKEGQIYLGTEAPCC